VGELDLELNLLSGVIGDPFPDESEAGSDGVAGGSSVGDSEVVVEFEVSVAGGVDGGFWGFSPFHSLKAADVV
jgi:hypothetical protein